MFGRKKSDAALLDKEPGKPHLPPAAQPLKPRPPQDVGGGRGVTPPTGFVPEISRRGNTDIPSAPSVDPGPAASRPSADAAKTLIVGRDISLNGAVADCDNLVVEGRLEADLTDSRRVEIAETGVVQGTADIEEADVSGLFEGSLTVRGRLMIRPTGRVVGAIRYGELAIEGGGLIGGEIATFATAGEKAAVEKASGDKASGEKALETAASGATD